MSTDMQKLTAMYEKEQKPEKRQKLKEEMDKVPLTSGELDQTQQHEADRKAADIQAYREKRRR